MKTYSEKLKSPFWQKKRLEVLQRAEWTCEMCGETEATLHVHHKQYIKGREPWEYESEQLSVLCEVCHDRQHKEDDLVEVLSFVPLDGPMNRRFFASLISGAIGLDRSLEGKADQAAYNLGKDLESIMGEYLFKEFEKVKP